MNIRILTALTFLGWISARSQNPIERSLLLKENVVPLHFTRCVTADLFSPSLTLRELEAKGNLIRATSLDSVELVDHAGHKSPWLAAALSLVVPGTGELYSESYLKGGIFFAVEAVAWVVAYTYDKKGDRQTDLFQTFADDHWSVVRYAIWMNANRSANIAVDPNMNLPSWERVIWDTLNHYEQVAGSVPLSGFTHLLPVHGLQQYYELIGKYPQYSPGWSDYAYQTDTTLTPSKMFLDYSSMRGKANDYYNMASAAFSVIIANHVISALDAFFTASRFNKSVHAEASLRVRQTPFGLVAERVGTLKIMF